MGFSTSLVCSVLLSFYFSTQTHAEKPCTYRSSESLCYEVISESKSGRYELRRYGPSVWVKTKAEMSEDFWENNSNQPFWSLFRYISGANKQGKKIAMTSPVLMSHTRNDVEMYFMLPSVYSDNPPIPTGPGVEIYYNPGGEFYVRQFGGWAKILGYNRYKRQLEFLKRDLTSDKQKYEEDLFFTAGYDSPMRYFERRNEVWIPKKN